MIIFKFPFGPLGTNAILIGCKETKKSAVIDPSMGSANAILQKNEDNQLKVDKILLTHSHWDHFVDACEIKERTKAPLYVHKLDAKNVEEPGSDRLPLMVDIRPVTVDHFLEEGEIIEVGNLKLEVIHTPGHSPGGVCFYLKEQKLLIAGDTLFKGSIGRLDLPTGEPDKMWESLVKLAKLPPDTRVIAGHGDDTTSGHEHWLKRAKETFAEE